MRAIVITQQDPSPILSLEDFNPSSLEGDVLIDVEWSTINFKDSMVTQPGNRVARRSPLIGGVDLAGTVRDDATGTFSPGDRVVVHGRDLGVNHHGGFAEQARVPASWVVRLPETMSTRMAMIIGTAGFTAMASKAALERHGLSGQNGPILVTGATGGVGSFAILLLSHSGYDVVASSGKVGETTYLERLGAGTVIGRDDIADKPERTLASERWAGAIDCVGGATLVSILRSLRYGGAVAASGLTGGTELSTTVYPFIIRGVSLLGIDAVEMPTPQRTAIWERLANDLDERIVESIVAEEIALDQVPEFLGRVAESSLAGRVLIAINN